MAHLTKYAVTKYAVNLSDHVTMAAQSSVVAEIDGVISEFQRG
jgi:hypothetical protein